MVKSEDIYAKALCQIMERALMAEGMDPVTAKILAGRACEEGVKGAGRAAKRGASKAKKGAKRKLNSWQSFVKKNKNKYKFKSGAKKGQINMKAMSKAFKKTPAGRMKR